MNMMNNKVMAPTAASLDADNDRTDAWRLLGEALSDYYRDRREGSAWLIQEDGEGWPFRVADFFRGPEELPPAEILALELSCGKVLDVGAGAGCHALVLQERGLDVCALDVSPEAVMVMRRRGVLEALTGNVFDSALSGSWDTLLMLMNGVGLVGDLAGLDRFFDRAHCLLAAGGQILLDSCDLERIGSPRERARIAMRVRQGRYRGETFQQLVYQGRYGAMLAWLYVDPDTLGCRARRRGWESQVVFADEEGAYLARLTRC